MQKAAVWTFLALIFSLGFMRPSVSISGLPVTVTDVLFVLCGALLVALILTRRMDIRLDAIYVLLAFYAIGLLLSAVFSERPSFSLLKLGAEYYLIALVPLTLHFVRTYEQLNRVVLVWLAASAVSASIGAIAVVCFYLGRSNALTEAALYGYGSLPPGNYPRINSTFEYASMLCNYLTVGVMMLLAAYRLRWVSRAVFWLLLGVFAVALGFTITPELGGVALPVAVWIALLVKSRGSVWLSRVLVAGGVVAVAFFVLASVFTINVSSTSPFHFYIGQTRIDPGPRLLTWIGAFWTFIANPIFGRGVGLGVAEVMFMPPSGRMQLLTDAHNTVLNVAGQSGLLGLSPLVAIYWAIVSRVRGFAFGKDPLIVALWLAFVAIAVVDGLVGSFENARHLWVLMGLLIASTSIHSRCDLRSESMKRFRLTIGEPWDFKNPEGDNDVTGRITQHLDDGCVVFEADHAISLGELTGTIIILSRRFKGNQETESRMSVNGGILSIAYDPQLDSRELKSNASFALIGVLEPID